MTSDKRARKRARLACEVKEKRLLQTFDNISHTRARLAREANRKRLLLQRVCRCIVGECDPERKEQSRKLCLVHGG